MDLPRRTSSQLLHSLLLVGLLGIGCASQSRVVTYNASDESMEYETSEMTIVRQIGSGYGSGSSITMRAFARCRGENCTPERVRLMFSVSGDEGVNFEDRSVSIVADGERYDWQDPVRQRREETLTQSTVAGQITGVRLRFPQLEQITNATSVEGRIGGRSFELSEDQRGQLRAFLSAMQNPEAWRNKDAS